MNRYVSNCSRNRANTDRSQLVALGMEQLEDVYGLPPLVAQTFGEAMDEAKTEEQEERRAKAIRRLDALYRHLSAPSYDSSSDSNTTPATQKMENWLQTHQS